MSDAFQSDPPAQAAPSVVDGLAQKAGSPAGLRAMLAASPALAQQIAAWFAAGNTDEALNSMMGEAFSPAAAQQQAQSGGEPGSPGGEQPVGEPAGADSGAPEKAPKDPTLPLPAALAGTKTLLKGDMTWSLVPANHQSARIDVDFKPDATKVDAKTVSYGQTVVNQIGANLPTPAATERPGRNKSNSSRSRIRRPNSAWITSSTRRTTRSTAPSGTRRPRSGERERGRRVGASSTKGGSSTSATMDDTPDAPVAREGQGRRVNEFETVPMVLETREPLGALSGASRSRTRRTRRSS